MLVHKPSHEEGYNRNMISNCQWVRMLLTRRLSWQGAPSLAVLCCYGTRHQMLSFHARLVLVQQEVLARRGYSDEHECVWDWLLWVWLTVWGRERVCCCTKYWVPKYFFCKWGHFDWSSYLQDCLGKVRIRGLVGMVRVRSGVMQYVY